MEMNKILQVLATSFGVNIYKLNLQCLILFVQANIML